MSQNPGPDEERPSWMGAPGYQPYRELPPHAPMPGAPPYPAGIEHDAPPVGAPRPRTSYWRALGATAIGAALNLVLYIVFTDGQWTARIAGAAVGSLIIPTALGSLVLWLVARRRGWAFWLLAVLGVVLYFGFRLVLTAARIGPA
jgi:hypothetical protein